MLELYQKESCPYCTKVRRAMEELDLDYLCHTSVKGSPKRELLTKLGGQEMVPFLVDTTDPANLVMMYESDDIIAYLEKTYGKK
ncbi:MAG: glutaredoxin [Candidatus Magasanikbacteria bacterium CG10_big_fil_rev_8_21_14_0_10_42_10]|uniref:Glutaredoxin n=2 Tax=Candidatus Magasanikiibacteriota TaxID=1752731 RepID=A0A2H0TXD1_9BACT|nr:MAG: glutaredoxin [Candidatus Magasanikbacteria bacterium CG10_big_fil_rev_8_21_14_0_10_42_10]PIZ93088.1 MAG: glutaredoxin [Candidatus Magasanikbacteria bacterium CG_4_10_14_0_2_um_filter_41_10]